MNPHEIRWRFVDVDVDVVLDTVADAVVSLDGNTIAFASRSLHPPVTLAPVRR